MKKLLIFFVVFLMSTQVFAIDEKELVKQNNIQTRINNVGTKKIMAGFAKLTII